MKLLLTACRNDDADRKDIVLRVRQEADGGREAGRGRKDQEPGSRLLIAENPVDALLYSDLAEREGTCDDPFLLPAAGYQRVGVGFLLFQVHPADHFFVAGKLDVSAEQNTGRPHQRMKPVNRKQQTGKRLPPVVKALQVRLFMRQHGFERFLVHIGGKVDPGADDPEDKW